MNEIKKLLANLTGGNAAIGKALMAPVFIVMVLSMMVLPLPSFVLDLFFTFNIAMALMVTLPVAATVGVPLINPVVVLMARPGISPATLKLPGLLVAVIW